MPSPSKPKTPKSSKPSPSTSRKTKASAKKDPDADSTPEVNIKALTLSIAVGDLMRNFDPNEPEKVLDLPPCLTPTTSMAKKKKNKDSKKKGKKSGTPDSSQPPTPTSSSALQSELSIPSGDGDDPVETDAEPSDVRLSPLLSEKRPSLLSPISEQRRLGYNASELDHSMLRDTLVRVSPTFMNAGETTESYLDKATDLLSTFSSNEIQTLDVKFMRGREPTKTMRILAKENDARKVELSALDKEKGKKSNALVMGSKRINVAEHLGSPRSTLTQAEDDASEASVT